MSISSEFKQAVDNKDILMLRIMLKDSLVVDPSFADFDQMISYATSYLDNLFDSHDGEVFDTPTNWNKSYMDQQMVKLINNFSHERITLLKKVCRHLYHAHSTPRSTSRVRSHSTIDTTSRVGSRSSSPSRPRVTVYKSKTNTKQLGQGLVVAGALTVVAGVALTKSLITGVGVTIAVVGGVIVKSNK